MVFTVQCVMGIWIGSKGNFSMQNIKCTNETLNSMIMDSIIQKCSVVNRKSLFRNSILKNILYLFKCKFIKIRMTPCVSVSVFTCIYITTIILARRYTPIEISIKSHMTLLVGYLTAAADIVDFAENSSNETITEKFGVDFTWGFNLFYFF